MWGVVGGRFTEAAFRFHGEMLETSGRAYIWMTGIKWVWTHPVGDPMGWAIDIGRSSHQSYLAAGILGGWIAMFAMLGLTFGSLLAVWRQAKRSVGVDQIMLVTLLAALLTLIINMGSSNLISNKIFWSLLAVVNVRFHSPAWRT
jgi:hypothetical protein